MTTDDVTPRLLSIRAVAKRVPWIRWLYIQLRRVVSPLRRKPYDAEAIYLGTLATRMLLAGNDRVISGPFAGMKYISKAVGSVLPAKILGTYERELHPWIEQLPVRKYDDIYNVGCAEGYYSVGLALRIPTAHIYSYDLDRAALTLVKKLAALNGVEKRISTYRLFDPASLKMAGRKSLIVCDVEGAEETILDPVQAPNLATFDILVEVHDGLARSTIMNKLLARFSVTHSIQRISVETRIGSDLPPSVRSLFDEKEAIAVMNERRVRGLDWLFMSSKLTQDSATNHRQPSTI